MPLTDPALTGFLSNLGFFAPVAALGWWVIKTMRFDLQNEKQEAKNERDSAVKRNEALTDTVIDLARSVEKTMAEFTAAIREGRK